MAEKINILQFMVIRPPQLLPRPLMARDYIHDQSLRDGGIRSADLFSEGSSSAIGRLVYEDIFCPNQPRDLRTASVTPTGKNSALVTRVAQTLTSYLPPCPNDGPVNGVDLELLAQRGYVWSGGRFLIPPDVPADLDLPLGYALDAILVIARKALAGLKDDAQLDVKAFTKQIHDLFETSELGTLVFEGNETSPQFVESKRKLFDALYVLYILRRRYSISLEAVIDALRALHLLEALAIDELLDGWRAQGETTTDAPEPVMTMLASNFPMLGNGGTRILPDGLPLLASRADLEAYVSAVPVVHPIFARLHHFIAPFNPIKPLGIGDLKVVKQWLTSYKVGEIAHIDNIMQGETKSRVHRHLEKTEDTFSSSSEQQEETQRDTQSTERFEVKRETDNVIKSDMSLSAGLNVSVTYQGTGYSVVSGVTAGLAYSQSRYDQTKTASNFAREVVDRAIKRVQSKVSQTRTTTKLFETEETNTHTFENKPPSTTHISGVYRWVDKEYTAQLFNYGKRMMFEFIVPEPASFLVESRLRAFESQLDYPRPPQTPTPVALPTWLQQMPAGSINEARYRELSERYDLSALPFPVETKVIDLIDSGSGKGEFAETGISGNGTFTARNYTCKLGSIGYRVTRFTMLGHANFSGISAIVPIFGEVATPQDPPQIRPDRPPAPDDKPAPNEVNRMEVSFAGDRMMTLTDNRRLNFVFTQGQDPTLFTVNGRRILTDDVTLMLGFWDVAGFSFSFRIELQRTAELLAEWQAAVRAVVVKSEQAKVDEANRELTQAYNAQLVTYRNRLAELRATAVNDLLQGQSEAANRQVILRELKRQCLAMITREFDAIAADDRITDLDAMGSRRMTVESRQFRVDELPNSASPKEVNGNFDVIPETIDVRMVNVDAAKAKGRYIQFLEQAFEWQQLSYFLYPYFWATTPRWVELMNRSDETDPFLSQFLQAGSARVLIAVTPAYDDAVLHFLATGEPWEGGPAPVIGDPLFIPLYEELKRQQDDLAGATAEGKPWNFSLPTSLVYLENSSTPLPKNL